MTAPRRFKKFSVSDAESSERACWVLLFFWAVFTIAALLDIVLVTLLITGGLLLALAFLFRRLAHRLRAEERRRA